MGEDRTADGPVRRAVLDGLLTDDEHEAVELAGRVACLLERIAGPDPSRRGDLAEMCAAIHTVQNAVLAQAAARAFPDRYRLMGASVVRRAEPAEPNGDYWTRPGIRLWHCPNALPHPAHRVAVRRDGDIAEFARCPGVVGDGVQ